MNVEILPANLISALLNLHVGKSVLLRSALGKGDEAEMQASGELIGKLYGLTEYDRHYTVTSIKGDNLLVCDFVAKDVIEIKSANEVPIAIVIRKSLH